MIITLYVSKEMRNIWLYKCNNLLYLTPYYRKSFDFKISDYSAEFRKYFNPYAFKRLFFFTITWSYVVETIYLIFKSFIIKIFSSLIQLNISLRSCILSICKGRMRAYKSLLFTLKKKNVVHDPYRKIHRFKFFCFPNVYFILNKILWSLRILSWVAKINIKQTQGSAIVGRRCKFLFPLIHKTLALDTLIFTKNHHQSPCHLYKVMPKIMQL